ncbi:MAG: glycine cleavage T C-terminal barrel domain-containing protein, partial [Acetobacteraceae bacterium]
SGLVDPSRPRLVGIRPVSSDTRLRAGAHLVEPGSSTSLGWVSSVTRSVESGGWIGLALLRDGEKRRGTRLFATFPLKDDAAEVEIVSPCFVDPENARVRA